jgi:alpha-N-arabinofuranosidase
MVLRSRKVTGPYEPWSRNPSLTQRDLDPQRPDPVTSTGHAQFVELQDGSWWAVFLATRPYRGNQYNLGRETFLLPVTWRDGWPVILPRGERVPMVLERPALPRSPQPVPTSGPIEWSERFAAEKLPPQWMTIHPPKQTWFDTGPDGLKLTPSSTPLGGHGSGGQPAYLAHRLQHHKATLTATLAPYQPAAGELAGLALFQNERYHYVVGVEGDEAGAAVALYRRAGKDQAVTGQRLARIDLPSAQQPVSLRFQLDGPRLDVLYSVEPDQWKPVATNLDASLLSADVAGGFIGATFGPYAFRP